MAISNQGPQTIRSGIGKRWATTEDLSARGSDGEHPAYLGAMTVLGGSKSPAIAGMVSPRLAPCSARISFLFQLVRLPADGGILASRGDSRSEERRVGKECRSRWS